MAKKEWYLPIKDAWSCYQGQKEIDRRFKKKKKKNMAIGRKDKVRV